jgi:hypothetical protein
MRRFFAVEAGLASPAAAVAIFGAYHSGKAARRARSLHAVAKTGLQGCARYGNSFLELRHGWGITA